MHTFTGVWITDAEFAALEPRNVFHRQLEPLPLSDAAVFLADVDLGALFA